MIGHLDAIIRRHGLADAAASRNGTVEGELLDERDLPGLKKSSAVIPGIRQVSKSRLDQPIGAVPSSLMERISKALTHYLED